MDFDVCIIGGSFAGLSCAYYLAKKGLDVCVFEKHKIGQFTKTTGILVKNTISDLKIPKKIIESEVKGTYIYSPSMKQHKMMFKDRFFYQSKTLDFLNWFKEKLDNMDVRFFENCLVNKIQFKEKHASCNGKKSNLLIFATGSLPNFLRKEPMPKHLAGIEYIVEGTDIIEKYFWKVYLDAGISPGYFSWIAPINDTSAHIGLLKYMKDKVPPTTSMNNFFKKTGFKFNKIIEKRYGIVPVSGPIKKTYGNRFIVVGDAAGQIGALSCAGINCCIEVGKIVGNIIPKYIDFPTAENLINYQKGWQDKIGRSLDAEVYFRKIYDRLDTNQKLEKVFNFLKLIPDGYFMEMSKKHFSFESTGFIDFTMKLRNPFFDRFFR